MKAPDKIYQCRFAAGEYDVAYRLTPHPYAENTEYIRKDLLLEWAKDEQAKCSSETHPYAMFMNVVIDKLNRL